MIHQLQKMHLKKLLLRNFRNYSSFEVQFSPYKNVICGDNASGKTNLIEAIYLISTGRSFRTLNLSELIKEGSNFFYIEAEFEKSNILETIKIYYDSNIKKITHNSTKYPSFSSLLGILPSVLHSPDDLNLIKASPALRRKFLNLHLAQQDPLYVHHYLRYIKALKQRNALLKQNKIKFLKPFEVELVKSGSYIIKTRNLFLNKLQKPLSSEIKTLFNLDIDCKLKYISSVLNKNENIESNFLKMLDKNRKKDLDFKTTLIGPHRDDFFISLDKKSAKSFASEGQKKLLLYALLFVQWQNLFKKMNQTPLLLIDDFDAHLDNFHKQNLKNALKNFFQVFITMPRINKTFEKDNIINIKKK